MSVKKKILFVNPHQFGHVAGYYFYCLQLKDYFDISFICFDENLEKLDHTGIDVYYIKTNNNKIKKHFLYIFSVIMQTRKEKYDLIFTYSYPFAFLIGIFSKARIKLLDIRTASISKSPLKRYLYNKFLKFQTFFFHKIIIITKELIPTLNLTKSKCYFLPLGSKIFFGGNHNYDSLNLLYVGALNSRNVYQTIEGLSYFLWKQKFSINIKYTIIGFGNQYEEKKIRDYINKYNIHSYVSFIGRKNYNDLHKYFKNSNIGISWIPITPYFDKQPATKTFEYILSGLYCIATGTKANKELISKNNGLICNDNPESFADSLTYVLEHKNNFDAQEIRETLIDFTWENIIIKKLYPFLKNL